jgi:hypothetical protein
LLAQHADVAQHAELGTAGEGGGTGGEAHTGEPDNDRDGFERIGDGEGAIEKFQ